MEAMMHKKANAPANAPVNAPANAPADASADAPALQTLPLEMLIQLRLQRGKDGAGAAVVAVPVPPRRARDEAKKNTNTNNKDKTAVHTNDDGSGNLDPHYAALGVPIGAAATVVKKAYSALARQHHPDIYNHFIHTGGNAAAAKKYHAVAEAYEAIMAKGPTTRTAAQDEFEPHDTYALKELKPVKTAPDLIEGHKSLMRGYNSIDPSNLPGEENPLRAALLRGVVVENHPDAATPLVTQQRDSTTTSKDALDHSLPTAATAAAATTTATTATTATTKTNASPRRRRRRLLQGGHPLHDAPEDRKAATDSCTAACCADVTCSAWQWCKAASKCDGETAKAPSTKKTDDKAAALGGQAGGAAGGAAAKSIAEMENKFENAQVKIKEHTHQAQGKA